MKHIFRSFAVLAVLCTGFATVGCQVDEPKELTSMNLTRCLEPMGLSAKIVNGDQVTFNWEVGKDADSYTLAIYSDKEMTQEVETVTIPADQVPYTAKLTADQSYYFKVQALNSAKNPSNWAVYEKAVKTFAVKDNLYLKVSDRTATTLSFTWTADPEVTHMEIYPVGDEENVTTVTLDNGQIAAAAATISGLTPSTNYVASLFYLSANRGEVNLWTMPDGNGLVTVNSDAALAAALNDGANILLTMEGSPYTVGAGDIAKGIDLSKGVKVYGQGEADGTMPVINGSYNITDSFNGGDIYFEGVELNGIGNTCGFLIQHKEGSTADGVAVNSIIYKNCHITGYSKGLFYEWGKTLKVGEMTWESCIIDAVNGDGSGGGDGIDIRQATEITKLNIVDNTIYNSFRTFVRVDANPVIGDLRIENNTIMNLCFVDNTNNAGLIAFQTLPGSISLKKNLFLNMGEKAALTSANAKYKPAADMNLAASANYFYNVPESFFTANFSMSDANGRNLDENPCFNAAGGQFNLTDTDLSSAKIGASRWFTPYVEEPEDLTQEVLTGATTWNFANAKLFAGEVKKSKVRDNLLLSVTENVMNFSDGQLNFTAATTLARKGQPQDGYLMFIVDQPGSVVLRPSAGTGHLVVAAETEDGLVIKGGAAAQADMTTSQKVLITDITSETKIYVYATGPVSLEKLAWSLDCRQVNTALPAPAPSAAPGTVTEGDATDIVLTWDAVDGAASYSVTFSGKTYAAETNEYTISSDVVKFLGAGSYMAYVYANPGEDDIYNTQSDPGAAAFAVLPKAAAGGDDEFVVSSTEELLTAISAGKSEITLAPGEYSLEEGMLTVTAPLALKGQEGATVKGAFTLSGEVGTFSLTGLRLAADGQGVLITTADDLKADLILVDNCEIDGYSKSVIYGPNAGSQVSDAIFRGITVTGQGTGQGGFDFRKGTFGNITIMESTFNGGFRDFIRADAAIVNNVINIRNNDFYKTSTGASNSLLYVRVASAQLYNVSGNIFHSCDVILAKTGTQVPKMANNFFYGCSDKFFTGTISQETATGNNGAVITSDPWKNAEGGDFTLVSGLAISNRVGPAKWNPSYDAGCSDCYTVNNAEELMSALSAGKTDIKLAAAGSPYELGEAALEIPAGFRLSGEVADGAYPVVKGFFNLAGTLGTVAFEKIRFEGNGSLGVLLNVSAEASADKVTMKDCDVDGYTKSVYYDNAGLTTASLMFHNVKVTNHGTGQGIFDIRKGTYTNLTIEHSTIVGGRDFIRADAGRVTGSVNIVANTFDGVTLENGNGILYVRSTPESYVFRNNLFLNETGSNNLLIKATGVTVPSVIANNFFYNCTASKFWTGLITEEAATANGGLVLSSAPCRNAAAGDYTLTDALVMSCAAGAPRWNPTGRTKATPDFTASSVEELLNGISVGKTNITLAYTGVAYDLTADADLQGILTIATPLTISGQIKGGQKPEVIGSIKLGLGTTSFTMRNIRLSGNAKALGNAFEIAEAIEADKILIEGCDIAAFNKSLFYGNGVDSKIGVLSFNRNLIHGFGTGQGMLDLRKGVFGAVIVENSTIYDGGRDFIRCDANVGQSISIKNNTFNAISIDASNSILYVRSDIGAKYVVSNNLFLNETGSATILAKTGTMVPVMKNNFFFNCSSEKFWTGTISQEAATANGGAVLEADPCSDSAAGVFKVTDAAVKAAKAGDPRWL